MHYEIMNQEKPTISFIIPLKDEAPTLWELHAKIAKQAYIHARAWEIIFIDDGSTDNSWNIIQDIAESDPEHVKAIRFRINRTKAPALATGYAEAMGEVVFTLDADLQDDPAEIPRFLEKLNEGWDIVSGYKETRHDPWHKVIPSRIFNVMLSKLNGVPLHDHNCGFKCYRQEVVKNLPMYGEMHRMVPSIAFMQGYRTTEIVVQHHARKHGVSKYGIERIMRGFLDMCSVYFIRTYRERPLHFMGNFAFLFILLACTIAGGGILGDFSSNIKIGLLIVAALALFMAPLSIMIGLLGELICYRHYKDGTQVPITERIESFGLSSQTSGHMPPHNKKPKILIIDDNPVSCSHNEKTFQEKGWHVITVTSSEEALTCITPDIQVILTGIYLPGASGIKTLPQLTKIAPESKVIILSSTKLAEDGARAMKAGAFDFLAKPVKRDVLLATAYRALSESRSSHEANCTTP